MSITRLIFVTILSMLAFAGNSILCRLALTTTYIDAATFTGIRLLAGSVFLFGLIFLKQLIYLKQPTVKLHGNWISAFALFAYAAGFSFAYISLSAATGALLLFGSVQTTMIGYGLLRGERISIWQWFGVVLALIGLAILLLPEVQAPSAIGAVLMIAAGVAWGVYSLRGRGASNPTLATAGNFLFAVPFAAVLSLVSLRIFNADLQGIFYAVISGAIASGLGYVLWYTALPNLTATTAAIMQLSVPVIAAVGGVILLDENIDVRLYLSSLTILGGIAIFTLSKQRVVKALKS